MSLVDEFLQEMKENNERILEKQLELMLKDKALTILLTITTIKDEEGNDSGIVVVFEDLTQLQKAERAAAWREVARRMAHEIKNPLTPVQLSAQRFQRKYGDKLGEEGSVFKECTQTIIDQVEVLKNLVNEFSRYARMPVTTPTLNDLECGCCRFCCTLFRMLIKILVLNINRLKDYRSLILMPNKLIGS